jgi:hypothetical protein
MSNLYTATADLTKAVQEKAKELGLEIEIESDKYWVGTFPIFNSEPVLKNKEELFNRIEETPFSDEVKTLIKEKCFPAIQAPQIRQILLAFQKAFEKDKDFIEYISANELCSRYLDGLNPMFDREPIQALEELTTIINNI